MIPRCGCWRGMSNFTRSCPVSCCANRWQGWLRAMPRPPALVRRGMWRCGWISLPPEGFGTWGRLVAGSIRMIEILRLSLPITARLTGFNTVCALQGLSCSRDWPACIDCRPVLIAVWARDCGAGGLPDGRALRDILVGFCADNCHNDRSNCLGCSGLDDGARADHIGLPLISGISIPLVKNQCGCCSDSAKHPDCIGRM